MVKLSGMSHLVKMAEVGPRCTGALGLAKTTIERWCSLTISRDRIGLEPGSKTRSRTLCWGFRSWLLAFVGCRIQRCRSQERESRKVRFVVSKRSERLGRREICEQSDGWTRENGESDCNQARCCITWALSRCWGLVNLRAGDSIALERRCQDNLSQ